MKSFFNFYDQELQDRHLESIVFVIKENSNFSAAVYELKKDEDVRVLITVLYCFKEKL